VTLPRGPATCKRPATSEPRVSFLRYSNQRTTKLRCPFHALNAVGSDQDNHNKNSLWSFGEGAGVYWLRRPGGFAPWAPIGVPPRSSALRGRSLLYGPCGSVDLAGSPATNASPRKIKWGQGPTAPAGSRGRAPGLLPALGAFRHALALRPSSPRHCFHPPSPTYLKEFTFWSPRRAVALWHGGCNQSTNRASGATAGEDGSMPGGLYKGAERARVAALLHGCLVLKAPHDGE